MATPNLRMTWPRCFPLLSATALLALATPLLAEDDAKPAPPPPPPPPPASETPAGAPPVHDVAEQLKALRTSLDQQTLQIEMLTRELSLLRKKIEGGEGSGPTPATDHPAAVSSEEKPAPGATPAGQPEVRAAEATGGGVKHVVAKGETLTSIAKQYNIPLATLQKANKIQDGRKLQIGQVLTIPSNPESSPEKKENP